MHKDRPVILLTGFGPFPTVAANASSVLVPRLADTAQRAFPGLAITSHVVPTEWRAGLARIERLYWEHQPAIALHFGVSSRATGFEIETRARNACCKSQDAAGFTPDLECLTPTGPEFLASPLPASHIVDRLRRRGLPASISRDAGKYLCNALLYRALEIGRARGVPTRAGFIHLPSSLVHERRPTRGPLTSCRLDWDDVVEGGLEIIAACLGRPAPPVRMPERARALDW